jgi:hypothetical protein
LYTLCHLPFIKVLFFIYIFGYVQINTAGDAVNIVPDETAAEPQPGPSRGTRGQKRQQPQQDVEDREEEQQQYHEEDRQQKLPR